MYDISIVGQLQIMNTIVDTLLTSFPSKSPACNVVIYFKGQFQVLQVECDQRTSEVL